MENKQSTIEFIRDLSEENIQLKKTIEQLKQEIMDMKTTQQAKIDRIQAQVIKGRGSRVSIELEEQVISAYEKGIGITAISDVCGIQRETVRNILKRNGAYIYQLPY